MMILIYSPRISNRLQYAMQFIFEDFCRIEYKLSSDIQYFKNFQGPKINYSEQRISNEEYFIKANGLLEKEGIVAIEILVKKDGDSVKLFHDNESDGNFDVFSAIFYLVSRYEEYLPFKKDKHGRFEADQSFAYQHGFLNRPIVDEWIIDLQKQLSTKFSDIKWKPKEYSFIPTLDIDQAFTIQQKSIWRFMKSLFSALVRLNVARLYYILKVRLGIINDPFDQFEKIEKLHKKYNLSAIYFFLFSKKYNRFDVNISIKNKVFRKRIREVSKTAAIGIHPSYHSRYDFKLIDEEIQLLSNVLNLPINSSRQHFLKMRLPNTYKSLLSLGIAHEYTMGYATMPGFRAGTTQSFRFYDIKHEQLTFLRVHPFCVMDATFKTYLNYTEEQAFECIKDLITKVKKVSGNFTPLWHNESMSGYREWAGWENLYEKMLIEGTNHPSLNLDNSSFIIHHS